MSIGEALKLRAFFGGVSPPRTREAGDGEELAQARVSRARKLPAWTEIEPGRFMPRRVRGSNVGRALG